jgi:hypothetical protein
MHESVTSWMRLSHGNAKTDAAAPKDAEADAIRDETCPADADTAWKAEIVDEYTFWGTIFPISHGVENEAARS